MIKNDAIINISLFVIFGEIKLYYSDITNMQIDPSEKSMLLTLFGMGFFM